MIHEEDHTGEYPGPWYDNRKRPGLQEKMKQEQAILWRRIDEERNTPTQSPGLAALGYGQGSLDMLSLLE